jgi:hypothetical protein
MVMKRWFKLPSPAMVVGLAALTLSVGGNVTAAVLFTGADIKDGTVRNVDLDNGTIRGGKIHHRTISGVKLARNSVTGAEVREWSLGKVRWAGKAHDADRLDGRDANALTRVARVNVTTTLTLTTSDQTYGSALTITAPRDGFVMISGSTTIKNDACTSNCTAVAMIRHVENGASSTLAEETVASGQRNGNIAHAWVFPVSAGVNSFDLRLYRHAAGDGALVGWFAELAAIYSPFGPTGHGPTASPEMTVQNAASTKDHENS